ncbi:TIGR00341 family protein [Ectothiorhodospira shaposhnikovii]|uniref:TIGR00341 family protein n=1 Tax=Ectothiorhodospira shaposhnikovii TaxID=1054 RepID=UPI001EE87069|nr:TIGR00341 family protein [Ectothiorhodospira shaposhnikovii]MCG5511968.1 TIGR00341 family protein [Ectothiorhodospira shaposhnikovii]
MRLIEVISPEYLRPRLLALAQAHHAIDAWCGATNEDGRISVRMVVNAENTQRLMEALQGMMMKEPTARIVVLPVETTVPMPGQPDTAPRPDAPGGRDLTLEELYTRMAKEGNLDRNFVMLIFLSTIAATIGLAEDNTAVVIGSMVIAPLLGPVITFAFGVSMGARALAMRALFTAFVGLGLAVLLSLVIGFLWPVSVSNAEVLARTEVNVAHVVLALTAGAAGVLALTSGITTRLVGVMVAVALLPPAAVFGMLLGKGEFEPAMGAALLLGVNVICVIIAAQFVFLFQGVKPRRWVRVGQVERFTPKDWFIWLLIGTLLLVGLVVLILVRGGF